MSEEKRSDILSEDLIKMIYKYTEFKPKGKMIVIGGRIYDITEINRIHIEGSSLIVTLKDGKTFSSYSDNKKYLYIYYNIKIDELKESGMIYGIDELYKKVD